MQTPHHDPIPRSHTLTLYSDPIPPILTPHPDPTRTAPLSPSPPPFPPSQRPIFCPSPSARLKHGGSAAPAAISRMFPLLNMATALLTPSFFFLPIVNMAARDGFSCPSPTWRQAPPPPLCACAVPRARWRRCGHWGDCGRLWGCGRRRRGSGRARPGKSGEAEEGGMVGLGLDLEAGGGG